MQVAIEMRNITKRFPGIVANDKVNLDVKKGEIHCLLGENGAGKSTLMNMLFGICHPDEGEILVNERIEQITNPRVAFGLGLGMVHQHFMLINNLTVLENIVLGQEHGTFKLDMKKSYGIVKALVQKYHFEVDLNAKVGTLSVGQKQRVEILKTLYRGADIIILDEPTAVLTPGESEKLMVILDDIKKEGKTIIFITHKLNETMRISDRITVLHLGKTVRTLETKDTTPEELATLMVGRKINFDFNKGESVKGREVLRLEGVKLLPQAQKTVSFSVSEGEIVGIAGVDGNGQQELEEMIMGIMKSNRGSIYLDWQDITKYSTKERKAMGVGYIPSDRYKSAMLPGMSIEDNYLLGYQDRNTFVHRGWIQSKKLQQYGMKMIEQFDVRTPSIKKAIGALSGGNQQKVILSREVSQDPKVLIVAQPVRGLDIGAIEYIHNILIELRNQGKAILLISAELTEISKLSDRIGVLYKGELVDIQDAAAFTTEKIGLLMAGRKVGE